MSQLFEVTEVFRANVEAAKQFKIVVNQGGTYSTKTYSILQCLVVHALEEPGVVITVAGQDIPNLKKGALRDMEGILHGAPLRPLLRQYHKTDRKFLFRNGSLIEFLSCTDEQTAKSGKRQYLFLNEANGIAYPIYRQLQLRTERVTYIDYNPDAEFWVHQHLLGRADVALLISDHRQNPFLTPEKRAQIEGIPDPELWKVYARGLTGRLEGVIFRNFDLVDALPSGSRLLGLGLDFGFTNDVTAVVAVHLAEGSLWVKELLYATGLTNVPVLGASSQHPNISDELTRLRIDKKTPIIADSAEQKSIAELRQLGWRVEPARKGPDSVKQSIDILSRYRLWVTRCSTNLRKELNTYKWLTTRDGLPLNEPTDYNNHAIDALRYVALNKLAGLGIQQRITYLD
jgi:phage terminase large subunit